MFGVAELAPRSSSAVLPLADARFERRRARRRADLDRCSSTTGPFSASAILPLIAVNIFSLAAERSPPETVLFRPSLLIGWLSAASPPSGLWSAIRHVVAVPAALLDLNKPR